MNKRSFFKSLALLGAAAAGCPGIFVPRFEPVRWKVRPVLNPEWEVAQYRIDFPALRFVPQDYYGTWKWVTGEEAKL